MNVYSLDIRYFNLFGGLFPIFLILALVRHLSPKKMILSCQCGQCISNKLPKCRLIRTLNLLFVIVVVNDRICAQSIHKQQSYLYSFRCVCYVVITAFKNIPLAGFCVSYSVQGITYRL